MYARDEVTTIERLQCHPGKIAAMFFGVPSSVTGCKQSVTDWKHSVTELDTPKNMATDLPG